MEKTRRPRRRRRNRNKSNESTDNIVSRTGPSTNNKEKIVNEKRKTDNKSSNSNRVRNNNRSRMNEDKKKENTQNKKIPHEIISEDKKSSMLNELKMKHSEIMPNQYTEEDYIRYRFSISEKYHDFTHLVYMTDNVEEAKQCISLYPNLKVFTNDGILAYPQPPLNCKNGYYYVRDEKTNKEKSKHTSLSSAITSCGNEMIVTDQNENRVY